MGLIKGTWNVFCKGVGCMGKLLIGGFAFLTIGGVGKYIYEQAAKPKGDIVRNVPGMTNDFVRTQLAKKRNNGTSTNTTTQLPVISAVHEAHPVGQFTVDLKTQDGSPRRFEINVQGRNSRGEIKVKVREIGKKNTRLGGMARLNAVFWDPANPEQKGLCFQLCFNDERGCFIRPYDSSVQVVYIGKNERLYAQREASGTLLFGNQIPNMRGTGVLSRSDMVLPEYNVPIVQKVLNVHNRDGRPIYMRRDNSR